ncbi:DegT/DnrJ/EryC1/StrS family aminotransferase [Albimonas pacifica]|uniref:dTDP-4-amino-4,6-dideoxygalactose transaminase n=1 Tax=Albimonas pacifica TaxID=1114924 RepID=A0A1I3IWX4_9RHOB|nr:DegT/DnrJ/EryC1/StrS aminotransferase family protein [Albimonas pacifica]SFI52447.1 dTDP-4-amino-4,6-dideoxygalactose transaminase [Albimonas pacifica]
MLLVSEPLLGPEEETAVLEVIRGGWLTQGPRVRAFERAFADLHGAADAVAVNSCTAALHLALAALGVGPGDEVLVPSLTFVATVNAVLYTGATPVPVDIESLEAPQLSLFDAAARLTPRTRAVIVMHYAGRLVDRGAWRAFARGAGLLLIEDSAHAVGVPGAGTFGDAAAFSFYGNKNMTTGEGGMVLLRDGAARDRARRMRAHGMSASAVQRLESRNAHYDVGCEGWNYRLDEIRAALGLVQLGRLPEMNGRRARLAERYIDRLGPLERAGLIAPGAQGGTSAHHIFPVLLPEGADRDSVATELAAAGVQTSIHYPPVHTLSRFRELWPGLRLPLSEAYHRRTLTLPLHPNMAPQDVDKVVDALEIALSPVEGEPA